jgi:hypothetical protein
MLCSYEREMFNMHNVNERVVTRIFLSLQVTPFQ